MARRYLHLSSTARTLSCPDGTGEGREGEVVVVMYDWITRTPYGKEGNGFGRKELVTVTHITILRNYTIPKYKYPKYSVPSFPQLTPWKSAPMERPCGALDSKPSNVHRHEGTYPVIVGHVVAR